MEGRIEVNGIALWHRITGEGEPVVQIHGSGFGHYNFDPVTPDPVAGVQGHRLRPARLRRVGPAAAGTTTWRCGPTTSSA